MKRKNNELHESLFLQPEETSAPEKKEEMKEIQEQ
jgi:hypothetical protein